MNRYQHNDERIMDLVMKEAGKQRIDVYLGRDGCKITDPRDQPHDRLQVPRGRSRSCPGGSTPSASRPSADQPLI